MTRTETIEVPFGSYVAKLEEIARKGGSVPGVRVENSGYVLSVVWPENTAGDATERVSATPPDSMSQTTTGDM